jgi:multidrug efflux system membrane fusion protein
MFDSSTLPEERSKSTVLSQQEAVFRRWVWVSIIGILLVVGYFLLTRLLARNAPVAPVPHPVPVAASAARNGDLDRYLAAIGSVTAFYTVTVKSRVNGQIVKVDFKEGQTVQQGDLLVEIDPRPYVAALEQAKGTMAKDQATLRNAQILLERDKTLLRQDVIAMQDYDNQLATVGVSEGTVKADQANIDADKVQVAYTKITAPITGRIGLRLVDPGNIVQSTDPTGLAVITQLQPIAVDFSIPEDNLQQIIQDMRKGQHLPVYAYDRDLTTRLATGTLETFDSQIDQTTGTIKLKAIFPNGDYSLFPNQFVNIKILVDTLHDAVLVPAAAIQRNSQNAFIYVVKPDNTVEARTVTVAATQGDIVAIASGIGAGEMVATDGIDKLTVGTKVTVQAPANPAAGQKTGSQ